MIRAIESSAAEPRLAEARAFRDSLTIKPLTDRELREARQAGRA